MIGSGRRSTTFRVSLGIVSLTIFLLLVAELMGVLPDKTSVEIQARQRVVELLAVQIASAATRKDVRLVQTTLTTFVERDETVLSAALRRGGAILAVAGAHDEFWEELNDGISTPTHIQIPIVSGESQWGIVELAFKPIGTNVKFLGYLDSSVVMLIFVGLVGFGLYFLYLLRVLRELDPSSVVPAHVRSAFDALAEGVIIVDKEERIVLANQTFSKMLGRIPDDLLGIKASNLNWRSLWISDDTDNTSDPASDTEYPWSQAIREGKTNTGSSLGWGPSNDDARKLAVNGAPIFDAKGRTRGAIATFDDVSELEQKNEELEHAMVRLSHSKDELNVKNRELQHLATRDSLTDLLNRRSFFQLFESRFNSAQRSGASLSAIMVDIDDFKLINDAHGHGKGDRVIQFVAEKMLKVAKFGSLAGRYGGEEFCLVLPETTLDDAAMLAERFRLSVNEQAGRELMRNIDLTISLGVASMEGPQDTIADLLNRADQALYDAKIKGKNRVVKWGDFDWNPSRRERNARRESQATLVRKTMSVRS